jgi:two-component system, cell cycle sensor histidine kinase and response regulator CckA
VGLSVSKRRVATQGRSPHLRRPRPDLVQRAGGPLITAVTLLVLILLRSAVPIPNPGIPLLLTVAIAAALGGVGPAMFSAALSVVFAAVDASTPGALFSYTPDALTRLSVTIVAAPTMAFLVGSIQQRLIEQTELAASRRIDERERALTDTATDAIVQIDPDSTILSANPAARRMFGHEDLVGKSLTEVMPDDLRARHRTGFARYLASGVRSIPWHGVELVARHATGREFPVEVSFGEYGTGAERRFTGIVRDISRRKELETELMQAQKMDAIGQLAGGVAHDFNNMLTVISGYASLLREEATDQGDIEAVDAIQKAAEQATELTRQLLAFSRRQELQPTVLDLNAVLARIEVLLKRTIGEDITLRMHRDVGLRPVLADPTQIETVVLNLATNARDAMPAGGTLIVETRNAELDPEYTRDHVQIEPGSYVMLGVSDTGVGMDRETVTRIFEPFFTTKEVGKGTGLGLATVYGIVKQSGGNIWVYSEPGAGTTFKMYFPQAQGAAEPAVAPAIRERGRRRSGRILVVEDETIVRNLILTVLERLGFDVVTASDGLEAERVLADPSFRVDALVTDVVMPGRSGPALADAIQATRPRLPVLFISGYTASALEPRGLRGRALLEKPFTPDQLEDAVSRLLESRPN